MAVAARRAVPSPSPALYIRAVQSQSHTDSVHGSCLPTTRTTAPTSTIVSSRFFSTRRRRRRQGDKAPESSQESQSEQSTERSNVGVVVPVKDTVAFVVRSHEILDHIEKALLPLRSCNDIFDIERTPSGLHLRLAPSLGEYILNVDEDKHTMTMQSPISGSYTYVLDAMSDSFVGEMDNHSMEGLLVRDLIRQCNGYPSL